MNKKFLAIIGSMCFMLFAVPLHAQYMSIGPSIGGGVSWLTYTDESVEQSHRFTWNAGATFVYSTESHLGFGADLKYSQEGSMSTYDLLGTTYDNDLTLNYLRLPLRAIYFFGEYGQSVRPKVFIGPTLGLLLSAQSSLDPGESTDVKDSFNTVDVGGHVGAGVNIKLAERIWLNTDITYYQGFTDATDDDITGVDETNLNGNVALNVGVAFGFGGNTPPSTPR